MTWGQQVTRCSVAAAAKPAGPRTELARTVPQRQRWGGCQEKPWASPTDQVILWVGARPGLGRAGGERLTVRGQDVTPAERNTGRALAPALVSRSSHQG